MSTAVMEPETVTERSTDDRPVHWVCLRQLDMPFITLCGDLPSSQLRSSGSRINCPPCLERVHSHAATCALCAIHARRY